MSEHEPNERPQPGEKFARFSARGKEPIPFAVHRGKLLDYVTSILELKLNQRNDATVRDEAAEMISGFLGWAKERLDTPGVQNAKLRAETAERFAAAKRAIAEARKTNAEAEQIELETTIRRFKLMLTVTKFAVLQDDDEAAVLFGSQIDEVLKMLGELANDKALLPKAD